MEAQPGKGPALLIGAYNTRGLRNSLEEVSKIAENLDFLFLSETWLRPEDKDVALMLDEYIHAHSINARNKGFGGAALIVNPMIKYSAVTKISTTTTQMITIRTRGMTLTGLYISPKATKEDEKSIRTAIDNLSRGRAIIIGDLNARHKR